MIIQKLRKDIQELPFWAKNEAEVEALLKTDKNKGLPEQEAKNRLGVFGENIIEKTEITPAFFIFLNQFKSPLILMLILAGTVTILIGHLRDSIFIFSAVVVNAALGFYQEYKAGKAIAQAKIASYTRRKRL